MTSAISGVPSPLKSPTAIGEPPANGCGFGVTTVGAPKINPAPTFARSAAVATVIAAPPNMSTLVARVTRSAYPSPVKSAIRAPSVESTAWKLLYGNR